MPAVFVTLSLHVTVCENELGDGIFVVFNIGEFGDGGGELGLPNEEITSSVEEEPLCTIDSKTDRLRVLPNLQELIITYIKRLYNTYVQ